jgi:uncharacterized phosphosugar-binding protein
MAFELYLTAARRALDRLERDQGETIVRAGALVAEALGTGGVLHMFGCGHSHMLAEEGFFRAGGLAAVNPILDQRLSFFAGAIESTHAEREAGLAARLLERETVHAGDAAIVASNSGRNVVPIDMALLLQQRGVKVIGVTSVAHSQSVAARHPSGRKLYDIADVVIDTGTPPGDAAVELAGVGLRMGPLSTVVGAAIIHGIVIEAAARLIERGQTPPVLPSANVDSTSDSDLEGMLRRYADRIRYYQPDRATR